MPESSELVYMDQKRVKRTLKRMAYQISEDNRNNRNIFLFGIDRRGAVVAAQLQAFLSDIYNREFPILQIDEDTDLSEKLSASDFEDTYPIIVDDVIFSGETMFTSLNRVFNAVPFDEIHTAVLVDRGHRTLPVQAQFVGLELATKLKEHVSVIINEKEDEVDKVVLEMS